MIEILVILIVIVVLLLIGVPVAFTFALSAILLSLLTDRALASLLPHAFWQIGAFAVLALPLFIMTGSIMKTSGISERLIVFINSLVGRVRGGLGAVTVISCALFGAIAGSGSSAIAAIGSIMIPRMVKEGYRPGDATALVACSSVLAQLIPPSIPMIVFALTAGISVAAAFLATVGAGIVIAAIYIAVNLFGMRNNENLRVAPKISAHEKVQQVSRAGWRALYGLFLPVIMLGGIYGGIFTPTEAAAVALVYALLIGFFGYRNLTPRNTFEAILEGVKTTGAIIFILFALSMLSRAMVLDQVPAALAEFLLNISDNKIIVLALINLILLIIGMLIDDISGSILAAVILMPVANELGIHPIHFAAIVGANLGLGNITPPCAPLLYMAGAVGKLSLDQYVRPTFKLLLVGHLPVVILVTYVPELSLFLPRVIMGIG